MGARVSPRDHHRNTQPAARFRNASSFFSNPPHAASHTQHAARFIYASSFLATRLMPQATRTQATRTVSPRDHHRNVPRAREPARRSPHPKNITRFVPPSLAGASSGHKYAIFWWFGFTSLVTHGGSSGAHAPSSIKKIVMEATVQHLAKYRADFTQPHQCAQPHGPCRSLPHRGAGARPTIQTQQHFTHDRQCAQPYNPCRSLPRRDVGARPRAQSALRYKHA